MLVSCCLLQINAKDSTLSMHDHLRDLAYGIVREESSRATERTRLLGRDAEDALKHGVQARLVAMLCNGSLPSSSGEA